MPDIPTITPDEAAELYCDGDPEPGTTAGDWTYVDTQHVRTGRWEERYWLVLRHTRTGELWGLGYGLGLTEDQECDLPWEEIKGPIRMDHRIYPHQVTRTEYRKTPPIPES